MNQNLLFAWRALDMLGFEYCDTGGNCSAWSCRTGGGAAVEFEVLVTDGGHLAPESGPRPAAPWVVTVLDDGCEAGEWPDVRCASYEEFFLALERLYPAGCGEPADVAALASRLWEELPAHVVESRWGAWLFLNWPEFAARLSLLANKAGGWPDVSNGGLWFIPPR